METLYRNKNLIFDIKRKVEEKDDSIFSHEVIGNNCVIDDNTITIIMRSSNRSKQVYFTLKTISKSVFKNVQLILVDDSTYDSVNVDILKKNNYSFYIDFIKIKRENKNWHNPLVNYNIGFQFIKGSRIIIQNGEVCHIGDVLNFINNRLNMNDEYYVFDVKASRDYSTNEKIYNYDTNNFNIYKENFYENRLVEHGWYQSFENNQNLHFLVSLTRDTFNKIKCFSYDYTMGSLFHDNDFLLKIISNNIRIVNIFHEYHYIGGLHLYHGRSIQVLDKGVESNSQLYHNKKNIFQKTNKYIDVTENIENFYSEFLKLSSRDNKKTIVTITGIYTDFIRMCAVFKELDKYFNHIIIHTGEHYDSLLSYVFFKQLGIRDPDYILNTGKSSSNHYEKLSYLSLEIPKLFEEKNINPDLILFLGDSNSSGVSFPLKNAGYKIGHIEAGMRSYDKRMIEEMNQTVCDHCSDILFVYHDDYKEQLIKENIVKNVYVVGNTFVEPFKMFCNDIIYTPKRKDMILLDIQRPENFKYTHRLINIFKFANDCIEKYNIPVKMLYFKRLQDEIDKHSLNLGRIEQVPLFPYKEYLETVYHCRFIISDSGSSQEEPALLGTPVIFPRDYTERPQSYKNDCSIQLSVEKEELIRKDDIFKWIELLENNIIQMNTSWLGTGDTSKLIVNEIVRFVYLE
jgi:UDP-N-acetylglucosamine 2-epimerase (non-hydrolysing)